MFMSLGPNSFIGAGMLIPIIEYAIGYAVQATAKLQRDRFKSMEVKARAVKDFDRYIDVSRVTVSSCRSVKVGLSLTRGLSISTSSELLPSGILCRAQVTTVDVRY